jgi:hypothetical protein
MKRDKPKEETIATTVRVERSFWGKVRNRAFEEGIGTGELIIRALKQYLEKGGRP